MTELKDRILGEMVVDRRSVLDQHFDQAKEFIGVTKEGLVQIKLRKGSAHEQVFLYLLGKAYAKEAEFSENDSVAIPELVRELGLPRGTIDPAVKHLIDNHLIRKTGRGLYRIREDKVQEMLNKINGRRNLKNGRHKSKG